MFASTYAMAVIVMYASAQREERQRERGGVVAVLADGVK
jgi:hypothetical protein